MRNICRISIFITVLLSATAASHAIYAGDVPTLTTFVDDTPAKAAEVNGNFTAIKTTVDENNARLGIVEGTSTTQATSVTSLKNITADHETRLKATQTIVDSHTTKIDALNVDKDFGKVPVGAIIAWNKTSAGTPALPDGWLECNGQTVFDTTSPYYTKTVPNLNDANLFLRGAPASGATGGSTTHTHSFTQTGVDMAPDASHYADGSIANPANHLPPYFEVVWIIRIK